MVSKDHFKREQNDQYKSDFTLTQRPDTILIKCSIVVQ